MNSSNIEPKFITQSKEHEFEEKKNRELKKVLERNSSKHKYLEHYINSKGNWTFVLYTLISLMLLYIFYIKFITPNIDGDWTYFNRVSNKYEKVNIRHNKWLNKLDIKIFDNDRLTETFGTIDGVNIKMGDMFGVLEDDRISWNKESQWKRL